MNGMSAQLNGLNAAALALQALAAANPALLLNQNPWLAQHMQLLNGQAGQGGAAMSQNAFAASMHAQHQGSIPLEAAQFAAQHLAAGQHLNGGGECCVRAVMPAQLCAVPYRAAASARVLAPSRAPSSCAVSWTTTTAPIACAAVSCCLRFPSHPPPTSGMAGLTQQLNGLNLLQQAGGVPTSAGHVAPPQDANAWLSSGGAADSMMFYPNGSTNGAWADPRSGTALM